MVENKTLIFDVNDGSTAYEHWLSICGILKSPNNPKRGIKYAETAFSDIQGVLNGDTTAGMTYEEFAKAIKDIKRDGFNAGQIFAAYRCLGLCHPEINVSLNTAIAAVEVINSKLKSEGRKVPGSESTLKKIWYEHKGTAHIWAALNRLKNSGHLERYDAPLLIIQLAQQYRIDVLGVGKSEDFGLIEVLALNAPLQVSTDIPKPFSCEIMAEIAKIKSFKLWVRKPKFAG